MERQPHTFCHYCGGELLHGSTSRDPRTCAECERTIWVNPLPVVVMLVPCHPEGVQGSSKDLHLVAVRRGIEPDKGSLALPSGYIDYGETWQEAAVRELREEIGAEVPLTAPMKVEDVLSSANKKHLLIFVRISLAVPDVDWSLANREVQEIVAVKDETQLCWSAHRVMANRFFFQVRG